MSAGLLASMVTPGSTPPDVSRTTDRPDLPAGLQDVARLPWITYELMKRGYTEDQVVSRGGAATDIHFLPKPFAPGELARLVRQVLDEDFTVACGQGAVAVECRADDARMRDLAAAIDHRATARAIACGNIVASVAM